MKTKIICIYNHFDLHWIEPIIEDVKEFGYELIYFRYPEYFQKWIEETKPDFIDFALIILGSHFSGDGTPNIKTGYYRGLEFYREEKEKSNNVFYKTETIIIAYGNNNDTRLKANNVILKKEDRFIDILDLSHILKNFLNYNKNGRSTDQFFIL